MIRIRTEAERPVPRRLAAAVDELKRDGVIIYPTDTGYSFGCAMSSARGAALIRRLKGLDERSRKPLTLLVGSFAEVGRYGYWGNRVFRMLRRCLPGPYTLVMQATNDVPRAVRNRDHEVGIRYPQHLVCDWLLEQLQEPLLTGSVTPGEAEPQLEDPDELELLHRVDVAALVDVGPLWPNPSTVLRLVDDQVEVLREGQGALP